MTIPSLPPAPALGDSPEVFNTKAFEFVAALDDWGTAANALAVDVNADAASADADAATATTQAGIATTGANTATTQAGIATTKAGEAATSANSASGSATAANLSAIAAAASAASAATEDFANFQSGGTANGVAYLNGSKVLTTGSALTFDGNGFGVGIATATQNGGGASKTVHINASGVSDWATNHYTNGTTGTTGGDGFVVGLIGSGDGRIFNYENTSIIFSTNANDRMWLDNAGNLGLGVTPSAWGSPFTAIDMGNSSFAQYNGSTTIVGYNSYADKYKITAAAGKYQINANGHNWNIAAPGTAGNAISFTQAMTLDASGNLGVGTTSPAYKLDIGNATGNSTQLAGTTSGTYIYGLGRNGANGAELDSYDAITFRTGSTSGARTGSEKMRLDQSGNLLVGSTAQVGTGNAVLTLKKGSGAAWQVGPISGNSNFYVLNASDVGVYVSNGGTSWTANSDERLKDIIEPITDAANKVSTLRAVIGKYKTDEEGTRRSFLIAQDVQAVLPEAVSVGLEDMLGVQYTEVIPLLVAAIKEQQTIITSLTARITALEA